MRSPYTVLGVGKTARTEDIKIAYRQLAKTWHPDQKPDDPQAGIRFAEIAQAYKLLVDPELRGQFDAGHIDARGRKRRKPAKTGRGFSANPFASFRQARTADTNARSEGADLNETAGRGGNGADMPDAASFEDMVNHIFGEAAAKQSRQQPRRPDAASGRGAQRMKTDAPGLDEDPLAALDALFAKWKSHHAPQSELPVRRHQVEISLETALIGYRGEMPFGDGARVRYASPPGTLDGSEIRVPSPDPACYGDVVVTFRHAHHPRLRAVGIDLHGEHAVNLAEAVLGGSFVFMGLDGPVRMVIPEWSGSDRVLRVPGLGLPGTDGTRGELQVHLRVMLPEKPDARLIELMRSSRRSWFM